MENKENSMREIAQAVYESLTGQLLPEYQLPWVEDAMAEGSICAGRYGKMLEAYWRLCGRLGTEEDPDGEIMIDSLLAMAEELCLKMFEYGVRYAEMSRQE